MADNLRKQPQKGILKNSSSFENEERQKELNKGAKWDEMNILATLHPKDKDYGHMKIEEPKTPYAYKEDDSGDEIDAIDVDLLAQKMKMEGNEMPKAMHEIEESSEEEEETPEERAQRKAFELKRKHHYNEFAAVKLARKLMEEDDEDGNNEKVDDGKTEKEIIAVEKSDSG